MAKRRTETVGLSIGVDVSDKYSHVCVLDKEGEVIEERGCDRRRRASSSTSAGGSVPW